MSKLLRLCCRRLNCISRKAFELVLVFIRIFETIKYGHIMKYENIQMDSLSINSINTVVPRKIFVLDLDETLVHSTVASTSIVSTTPSDFKLKMSSKLSNVVLNVHKRPHVDFFLDTVSKWYDLAIYTASSEEYGSSVADWLDNNRGILTRRYYRQHCTLDQGSYTKDLSLIGQDLSNIFIMDNSPEAYKKFPNNAIPISSWYYDRLDTELLSILPFLDDLRFTDDVRSVLSHNMHLKAKRKCRSAIPDMKTTSDTDIVASFSEITNSNVIVS